MLAFIAEKEYLAEWIEYVRLNLNCFLNRIVLNCWHSTNNQELEEEGKPSRSLLCIPRIGNKVPKKSGGVSPRKSGGFILELYYPWQAIRLSLKRYMTLLQKKIHSKRC